MKVSPIVQCISSNGPNLTYPLGGFGNFYTMKRASVPEDLREQLDRLEQKETEVTEKLGQLGKVLQMYEKTASS